MLLIYDRLRLQMSSKTSSHITIAMSLSIIPSTSKIYDDYFSYSISEFFYLLYDVWSELYLLSVNDKFDAKSL